MEDNGRTSFFSDLDPFKEFNFYQNAFVSLLFEPDINMVRRCCIAIRLLGLADVCASKSPNLAMRSFESEADALMPITNQMMDHFGSNLNFKMTTI